MLLEVEEGPPRPGDAGQRSTGGRRGSRRCHAPGPCQRALARLPPGAAGRSQAGPGDFWTWREQMYAVAARLDPESYFALARALFAEMALSGVTAVGEFHYLHHGPAASRYSDPNAMGEALIAAAGGRPASASPCSTPATSREASTGSSRGSSDGSGTAPSEAWAERAEALAGRSTRADRRRGAQRSRRRAGLDRAGRGLGVRARRCPCTCTSPSSAPRTRAVWPPTAVPRPASSATRALSGRGRPWSTPRISRTRTSSSSDREATAICMCPTTERDLADGVGPARDLAEAGSPLCVGSDSHAVMDLFEEARGIELDERLVRFRRGIHTPEALLEAATLAGHRALGWPEAGRLAPGALADFVTVRLDSPRLAGTGPDAVVASLVFAATGADVTDVVVARPPRRRGRPPSADRGPGPGDERGAREPARSGGRAVRPPVGSLLVRGIGLLVTNRPELGEGALGTRRDVDLVVEDGVVAWIGDARARSPAADSMLDAAGRCVVPGFVDSHTHLVFAGDRVEEFTARMAGTRYDAGGISTTVAATRAAPDEVLRQTGGRLRTRGRGSGHDDARDEVGLRPDRRGRVAVPRRGRNGRRGGHLPRRSCRAAASTGARRPSTSLSSPGRCSRPARRKPGGATSSARRAPSSSTPPGRSSRPVVPTGSAFGCTRTSSRTARGSDSPSRWAPLRPTIALISTQADVDALAGSETVATLLPGAEFSTRSPYPDARRLLDSGVTVALATDCNPGTSYTTSMPFVIALAVREMHMTPDEALFAATAGGARALRRDDLGALAPGCRGDLVVLEAPTAAHLAYRPGVDLVGTVVRAGRVLG